MHYVYVLHSEKDDGYYIGRSDNLDQRFAAHNEGLVASTLHRRPLTLVYYEAYETARLANEREQKLKDFGSAYKGLFKRLGRT